MARAHPHRRWTPHPHSSDPMDTTAAHGHEGSDARTIPDPFTPVVQRLNDREGQPTNVSVERRVHTAGRTAAGVAIANTATQERRLEELHASISELARLALPHVGTDRDVTAKIEIIRPLPQDRLWSEKLRRRNTGQGFTRSEYMTGMHTQGSETRRFQAVQGPSYDNLRGVALPYAVSSPEPLNKRPRVRPNSRPEDLAIALDDSGRAWSGILAPYDTTPPGATSDTLKVIGVLEDPKSQLSPFPYNMLANQRTVVPTDREAIGNRILWLEGINDSVIELQQQVADPGHLSHRHVPRP